MSNPAIIQQLRSEGYGDADIAQELGKSDARIGTLLSEGYAATDILDQMFPQEVQPTAMQPTEPPDAEAPQVSAQEMYRADREARHAAEQKQKLNAATVRGLDWIAGQSERERLLAAYAPSEAMGGRRSPEERMQAAKDRGTQWIMEQSLEPEKPAQATAIMPGIVVPPPSKPVPLPYEADVAMVKDRLAANGEDPTVANILLGMGAQIGIEEISKWGGAAAGAALAAGAGQAGPQVATPEEVVTAPAGALGGYITGAVLGGVAGSLTAQKIEGRNNVSWGRVLTDVGVNLLPFGEVKQGPKAIKALSRFGAKTPILRNMVIGAAIAPAAQIAESEIDQQIAKARGEYTMDDILAAPSGKDLAVSSAISAGLAGAIGVSDLALRKFFARKPKEVDTLIRNGDRETGDIANALMEKSGTADTPMASIDDTRSYVQRLVDKAGSKIAPSKVIGQEAMEAIREAGRLASAGQETGGLLGDRVDRWVAQSGNPEESGKWALDYLMGQTDHIPAGAEQAAKDLAQARGYMRNYQEQLLDNHYNGTHTLEEPLLRKIEKSVQQGDYLTRSYRWFNDPSYKPSREDRLAMEADLRSSGMSQQDIDKYVVELNAKRADPDAAAAHALTINSGILKNRKDVPESVRRYLGEYTRPGEKLAGTMSNLSRVIAYDSADATIAKFLTDTGIAKPIGGGVPDGWSALTLRRGNAKVDGVEVVVPKEINDAVSQLYGANSDHAFSNLAESVSRSIWQNMITWSKASKVLGNPPSYAVQLYGNLSALIGQGMNPFRGLARGAKVGAAQFSDSWIGRLPGLRQWAQAMPNERIDMLKEYKELGVAAKSLAYSDMEATLMGRMGKDPLTAATKSVIGPLGKAYSAFDAALRISSYENNKTFLLRSLVGEVSPDQLKAVKKMAARMTNDTYQNYDYLNSSLKHLSRIGVPLSQFASFSMELARNQANQANIAKRMMSGAFADELTMATGGAQVNRKRIAAEGAKRMTAQAVALAASGAGVMALNRTEGGVDEEQERALRESVIPSYDQQSNMLMRLSPDGKTFEYANASYILPHAQLAAPLVAAYREQDPDKVVGVAVETLAKDFLGEGSFAMNTLAQAFNNRDMGTGRPISYSKDTLEKAQEITGWAAKDLAEPGFMREMRKAKNQPASTTVARQAGIRINTINVAEGVGFRLRESKLARNQMGSEWAGVRMRAERGELSKEAADAEYERMNRQYQAHGEDLAKHFKNLQTLKWQKDDIIRLYKDQGIGSEDILHAIHGKTRPLAKAPRQTSTDVYERDFAGQPMREQLRLLRGLAKEDVAMAKAIQSKIKDQARVDALHISEEDKLVKSLGASDGTRAAHIWWEMQQSTDPQGVLRQYIKRGVVDATVNDQIRKLRAAAEK